jgi:uncharacterized membrane protein
MTPMNLTVILAVLAIGLSIGLRTFTGPAVVASAAYAGCINLGSTPLSFMASPIAVGVLSLAALGEYVYDLLPIAQPRTAPPGLIGRFVSGSFSAACLLAASGQNLAFCILGGVVAIGGAFAGYRLRVGLGRALGVKDAFIAVPEDLIAVGIALAAICLVH